MASVRCSGWCVIPPRLSPELVLVERALALFDVYTGVVPIETVAGTICLVLPPQVERVGALPAPVHGNTGKGKKQSSQSQLGLVHLCTEVTFNIGPLSAIYTDT